MKQISLEEAMVQMLNEKTCINVDKHGNKYKVHFSYEDSVFYFEDANGGGESGDDFSGDWFEEIKRPMYRSEMLGKVTNTPGIVVRFLKGGNNGHWQHPARFDYHDPSTDYEWTTCSPKGVYGEPQKFEVME